MGKAVISLKLIVESQNGEFFESRMLSALSFAL
jgi:hypothetical protein